MNRLRCIVRIVCVLVLTTQFTLLGDETVRRVQEELRKRNLFFGDVDGRLTPELSGAIERYQERKDFQPTGKPDAETLRSLGVPVPPNAPAGQSVGSPLPDVPVLRSDTQRRAPAAAGAETAAESAAPHSPSPIMESAPATSPPSEERFPQKEVREFIESYLHDAETNNLDAEMSYYADPLDYFDHGIVDLRFVEQDVQHYYKRWPQRKYELLSISQKPVESRADEALVAFRISFTAKNDQNSVQGQTDNSFRIKATGSNYKIVSMREERVVSPQGSQATGSGQ
jgi:Putative peptidoglycan binding domain